MIIEDKEKQFENGNIELPEDKNFFVIVGANNSGKSTFLRSIIKTDRKEKSYLVTVNRNIGVSHYL
jgi:ABC-type cobalamin/Fe3+-siderophores transport system ATPase subunit